MEAVLAFEVLMYMNMYFFPMFGITNVCMCFAKYTTEGFYTPLIGRDACVQAALNGSELLKLVVFQTLRAKREGVSISIALAFTTVSVASILYVFILQHPTLKLEYGLDIIMFFLLMGEIVYGLCSVLPCCNKNRY